MTAPRAQRDALYRSWCLKLDLIAKEITQLHHHRELWLAMLSALTTKAGDTPDIFLRHYSSLYVDGQAMGVRRLVKRGENDKGSLGRIIFDLGVNPAVMTRTRFVDLYRRPEDTHGHLLRRAADLFDREYGSGGDEVEKSRLDDDLTKLDDAAGKVVAVADDRISHVARGEPVRVTFGELDQAITLLGDMFRRYALLLTASDWARLEPVMQHDWQASFRRPLFS